MAKADMDYAAIEEKIPKEVRAACFLLTKEGYKAYLVGGCVRDLILERAPKDWDVATNASPEEIQKIFPESVYENTFGTVGVKTDSEDPKLKIIEITTFRTEGRYTDFRHPDEVRFAESVEEDLARRDFTMNAVAMDASAMWAIVDPFDGAQDIDLGIIRTVGDPAARFTEDALRLMRAVRFSAELGFEINSETSRAIEGKASLLEAIAKERIRDEFSKLLMSDRAAQGIVRMEQLDLLRFVMPELREGLGVGQNKHHIYTVFEHNVKALEYTARQGYSLEVRMAALLHDVGKPRTKKGDGPDSTFYNHEHVGARMTLKILDRLRYSKDFTEKVTHLVRCHLFYYNVGEVSETGVRRFLKRVGSDNVDDLLKVREADRIGSGVPKAVPYKLRHLQFMIDKVKRDPVSPKMLTMKGEDVMRVGEIPASPKVGYILAVLLDDVIEDPSRNTEEYLVARIRELALLSDAQLEHLRSAAQSRKEEFEKGVEEEMKKTHRV